MIYAAISALLGSLIAGRYGRVSDSKGRRRALAMAAVVQLLSCVWGLMTGMLSPEEQQVLQEAMAQADKIQQQIAQQEQQGGAQQGANGAA